ncbi:DUF4190 domain-containing protein [Microbacterium sp. NPDC089189]|uniref:DUF4190 domain-containing protein n=1 Tax=Microbacterium sp. NPDC089189 TaxID=3154972 RepID=UPI003419E872
MSTVHEDPSRRTTERADATGLDITAIICAFVVAPVGIILGAVSRAQATKRGVGANTLSTLAIVLGSVFTALGILAVVVPIVVFGTMAGNAVSERDRQEACADLSPHVAALTTYGLLTPITGETPPDDAAEFEAQTRAVNEIAEIVLARPREDTIAESAESVRSYSLDVLNGFGFDGPTQLARAALSAEASVGSARGLASAIEGYCGVN